MNKYRNRKTRCLSGHLHDSKKEADYCNVLLAMKKNGEIEDYEIQPRYELLPGFTNSEGKRIRPITYTPDFVVYRNGQTEIIDVKGGNATKTQLWNLKWKWLQYYMREKEIYKFTII